MENALRSLIESSPFTANVKYQCVHNERGDKEDAKTKTIPKEQLLTVQVNLPVTWKNCIKNDTTYLLVVVDVSGSMSGNPIEQVKTSLIELLSQTTVCKHIKTEVIAYNHDVSVLKIKSNDYQDTVKNLRSSGTTNFVAAFHKIKQLLSKCDKNYDRAVVVFMTDGQDTVNKRDVLDTETRQWMSGMKSLPIPVTVHSVGFSKGHNFEFMSDLIKAGTGNGMYRYCEAGDGPNVLMEKLQELFDFILQGSGNSVDVCVTIDGENKINENGESMDSCVIKGTIDTDSDTPVVTAEAWILNQTPDVCPLVTLQLKKIFKQDNMCDEVTFPCDVSSSEFDVMTSVKDKCFWNLKLLSRNADHWSEKLSEIITNRGDATVIEQKILKIQDRLSRIPLFGKVIDKDFREEIRKQMVDIQEKINKVFTLIADYARQETVSVGMLARAHDMRYQAQFSKSRRHRLMDRRAAKNLTAAKTAQGKLSSLNIDEKDVENIPQTTCDFYYCALSQNSVKDVLLGIEQDNLIGFGLAVKRAEVVLDEPSLIWIHNISGTIVSRSSMLDALEFKLKIDGQLQAHGGFNFDLGVTTVGLGREPINAWLPLYVNKHHWERAKILLRPVLGYFCTLDPLGYDYKQIDIMFVTLGSMISQLSDTQLGEHQIKMILCFHRTCQACLVDFDLVDQVTTILTNFITSPAGRTKDVIPNLLTLIGYLVSLPKDKIKAVLECNDKTVNDNINRFWKAFIAELLRRSGGTIYKETCSSSIFGYVDALLNAKDDESQCDIPENVLKSMFKEADYNTEDIVPQEFDVRSDLPSDLIPLTHGTEYDKAMEIWAQSKLDIIRNKNQADKVTKATKVVNKWIMEGQKLSADSIDKEKCSEEMKEDKSEKVTQSMLRLMVQVIRKLVKGAYPQLSCVPGCVGFVNFFLGDYNVSEFDQNGGLPPVCWLDQVKKSVMEVYQEDNQPDPLQEENQENTNCKQGVNNKDVTIFQDRQEAVEGATNNDLNTQSENHDADVAMATSSEINPTQPDTCTDGAMGTGKIIPNNDLDSDDNDIDFEYGVPDDDDTDYVESVVHPKSTKSRLQLNLLSILHRLDKDINLVQICRVLTCQILLFPTNSKARAAIQNGEFIDISSVDNDDLDTEVSRLKTSLIEKKQNAIKDFIEQTVWKRTNHCLKMTDSIWAFIGYLMAIYTERNEGIKWLIADMMDETATSIPLLADKVRILFLGKYQDHIVLARGNVYIPDGKVSKQFSKVLGEEVWNDIELDCRSKVTLHVYRESDIPNRHGHCNSNPYIPNSLRSKLGMPLLKEHMPRKRPSRIRSKQT